MGFKYFPEGPSLVCWTDQDYLWVENPCSAHPINYKINIGLRIDAQINTFYSQSVVFVLKQDGIIYVGRSDGTWTGYKDDLIVRFGQFQLPQLGPFEFIGMYVNRVNNMIRVFLDVSNKRVCYLMRNDKIYVFNKEFDYTLALHTSLGNALIKEQGLHIHTIEGKVREDVAGKWFVPSLIWSGDSEVKLQLQPELS
ncbi:MAG: hypothetical protein LBS29_04705 [Endomicrobium sp.]|jgi:hypothetical protein|nr:hypothetical protein [Endomicrobium sp.]